MLALSGTAAGAQRAQIRPTRVKEGGSDTAKRCFRGPHELAFIRSKIFIYPQFASSVAGIVRRPLGVSSGCQFDFGKLTLLIFSHLSGLNFALDASYEFELVSSR